MDPITIAMGLAQFVPQIAKWITGSDKAAAVAQKAIDLAKVVTGKGTGEEALASLQANPDKVLEYRKAVLDQAVEFEKLAVENAKDINATMRTEAAGEHWPTYSWRPMIGFAVAIDLVGGAIVTLVAYAGVMFCGVKPEVLSYLPAMLGSMAALVGVASPILGIASWFRGKMQADPNVPTVNRG